MADLSKDTKVAFIGLGNMGVAMAKNLSKWLKEGGFPPLQVWNRTKAKAEKVVPGEHMEIAESVTKIALSCDIIITSLSNDTAAEEVYGTMIEAIKEGGKERSNTEPLLLIDTSTLYPSFVGQLEERVAKLHKCSFLSCPVFGPPPLAQKAGLLVVISGDGWGRKRASQLLVPSIGSKTIDVGYNVERAAGFKLIGNSMVLGCIELLAETMTLADKSGVGSELLYDLIQVFFPAPSFLGYGKKIMTNSFSGEEGFTLSGGIKDACHIRKYAEAHDTPMPIVDVAHQHLVAARANGGDHLDWSSLVGGQRISSGLHPFKKEVALQEEISK